MPQETTEGVVKWSNPNLFGTIGQNKFTFPIGADFIPLDGQGNVLDIREEACWRGLSTPQMQFWAYKFCSPLSTVIDRLANSWINGKLMFLQDNDNIYTLPAARKIKALFMRPNPMNDYYQHFATQQVYKKIFGYCPVYMYKGRAASDNTDTKYMWNLNPFFCTPVINDDFDILASAENPNSNPIKEWQINVFGYTATIPASKILIIKDGYLDFDVTGLPLSKIEGLDWAVSNICAAMEADNVLLRKKGPLGFISHDPPIDNVGGYISMTDDEKREVQTDLGQYGLTWSQWQYVITRQRLKWNPVSFNVRDLDTKATIKAASDNIADRFNYPAELMSGKDATYENRTAAEKWLIQNVTMPESQRDDTIYTNYFNVPNLNIFHDYSKLPIMQENLIALGEGMKYLNEAYQVQFMNNLITLNQWRIYSEIDTVDGDDIYYSSKEYIDKYGKYSPVASKSKSPKTKVGSNKLQ